MDDNDSLVMFEQEFGRIILTKEEFDEIASDIATLKDELNQIKALLFSEISKIKAIN